MNQAVFFDRDGTLIKDKHYLDNPDEVEWYEGTFGTLRALRDAGYKIVVVTNQSGVARGKFGEETVQAIHERMERDLADEGIEVEGFYYCPYLEEADVERYRRDSDLRKPSPGMLLEAAEDHDLDLGASVMVGDKPSDVEAGNRVGCRTILVETGKSVDDEAFTGKAEPDVVLPSIADVAENVRRNFVPPAEN